MAVPVTQRTSNAVARGLGHVLLTLRQNPLLAALGFVVLLTLFFLLMAGGRPTTTRAGKGAGVQLSPVNPKEYEGALVQRYEQQFHDLQSQVTVEGQQRDAEITKLRGEVEKLGKDIEAHLGSVRQALDQHAPPQTSIAPQAAAPVFRHIVPSTEKNRPAAVSATHEPNRGQVQEIPAVDDVELPAGSWVSGTLLTGVLAPADDAHPLPILLRINEAFTGPNHARIPLQGCFALGKAAADLRAERSKIQLATLSCTLPSGEVFERDVSGFVVDGSDGSFGVRGAVVQKDAKALGMATLTGFLAGAGQALARAESTVTVSPFTGTTTTTVHGNIAQYAGYSGLARTANQLARYYLNIGKRLAIGVIDGADRDQNGEDCRRSAVSRGGASGDGPRRQDGYRCAAVHPRSRHRDRRLAGGTRQSSSV